MAKHAAHTSTFAEGAEASGATRAGTPGAKAAPGRADLVCLAALPVGILLLELVFKASTTGGWWPALLFVPLFSLAVGGIFAALVALLPRRGARAVATGTLLALVAVAYAVEYFVFRQFKVYYDLKTVTAGAGGVATGFADQAAALVLSPAGLSRIALLFAPTLAFALAYRLAAHADDAEASAHAHAGHFSAAPAAAAQASAPAASRGAHFSAAAEPTREAGAHFAAAPAAAKASEPAVGQPSRLRLALGAAAMALVAHLLAFGLLQAFPAQAASYGARYVFQDVVETCGLATGLRKEVQRAATGEAAQVSFQATDAVAASADEADAPNLWAHAAEGDLPVPQGRSELPLDFAALAETTSGTWADLDRYAASLTPSSKNAMTGRFAGKNLILISAEAFSAEAIREDTTPTLYRMATRGIQFTDYYQFDSAGTTGGECQNLLGMVPTEGGSSVIGTSDHNNWPTIGNALNRLGYEGWAFHNNTYTYYSRDRSHNNLGYNHGYMGYGNGMEQWVTWQWPQSDLEMIQGTFDNLYGDAEPFNVYYMSVSGHSGYTLAENAMSQKWWDVAKDLPYSEPVRGYLACNVDLDRAMEWLIGRLEEKGIADDTVIVIGADHFPYGLDDDGPLGSMPYTAELYGMESVDTYFQRDHNRLIVWSGCLEDAEPIVVDEPVMSIDILPTLLNLFGCEWDSRLLPGRDVFSDAPALAFDPNYDWKTTLGTYYARNGEFVPAEGAEVPEGYVEQMNAVVANKTNFCRGVLTSDWYRHLFGDPEDVAAVNARGKAEHGDLAAEARLPLVARRVERALAEGPAAE